MMRNEIPAWCVMCTFLVLGQAYAQDRPSDPIGSFGTAADGWHQGQVSFLLVNDAGYMRVGLTPDPSDSGVSCSEMPAIYADSSIVANSEEARWVKTRLYEAFADAMEKNATVSVYLEEVTLSNGEIGCNVQRVQVWATQDSSATATQPTQPTQPTQTTPPTQPGSVTQYYGALAVNSDGSYWIAWNYTSQSEAENSVLNSCQQGVVSGCRIVLRAGSGQCMAFARDGQTGAWGATVGNSAQDASNVALQTCRNQQGATNCTIAVNQCNATATSSSLFFLPGAASGR